MPYDNLHSPAHLEEEVRLLLAEIATLRTIRAAELSVARALSRREAITEALAVCSGCDDGAAVRKAIAALPDAANQPQ